VSGFNLEDVQAHRLGPDYALKGRSFPDSWRWPFRAYMVLRQAGQAGGRRSH